MKSFLIKIAVGACLMLFYQPTFGQLINPGDVDLGVVTELLDPNGQSLITGRQFDSPLPGTGTFKVKFTNGSMKDKIVKGGVTIMAQITQGTRFDEAAVAAAMPAGWTFTMDANQRILHIVNTNTFIGQFSVNNVTGSTDGIVFSLPFTYDVALNDKGMAATCYFNQVAVDLGYYDAAGPLRRENFSSNRISVKENNGPKSVDIGVGSLMYGPGLSTLATGGTYTTVPGEGVLGVTFNNGSATQQISPNSVSVNAVIPNHATFKVPTNLPVGWTFTIKQDGREIELINTNASVSASPNNANNDKMRTGINFYLPFEFSETFTHEVVNVTTAFTPQGSQKGYSDPEGPVSLPNQMISYMTVLDGGSSPISLNDFTVEAKDCDVAITWTTLSESNVDYYSIDRSEDGKSFNSIGKLTALGNNKSTKQVYTFSDQLTGNGLYYYRIREVDMDRKNFFTSIKTVNVNCGTGSIALYPNPTKGIVYVSGLSKGNTVVVYNALGQSLNKISVLEPTEVVDITKHADGAYLIKVFQGDKEIFNGKVIKQ